MPYNGSGIFQVYTPGTPFVTGTTISSTVANNVNSDFATGLSTAITKDGQTTPTAGIGFFAGTVSLPGIYLKPDTATGLYRIAQNNPGFSINGTKLLDLSAALVGLTGALTTTGSITQGTGSAGSQGWVLQPRNSGFSAIYSTAIVPGAATYTLGDDGTNSYLNAQTGGAITFRINNSEGMQLSASKQLFINTASAIGGASEALQIAGFTTGGQDYSIISSGATSGVTAFAMRMYSTTASAIVGSIQYSGTATTYNTSSDERLKTKICAATSVDVLSNAKIWDFSWNEDGTIDRGVMAQEAYKIKPSAVSVGGDDPKQSPWGVDYSKFVSDLIVGWQAHEARIAVLEQKILEMSAK